MSVATEHRGAQDQGLFQTQPQQEQQQGSASGDNRTEEEIKTDNALAERLSSIIEQANERVVPITKMIRKVRLRFHHNQ